MPIHKINGLTYKQAQKKLKKYIKSTSFSGEDFNKISRIDHEDGSITIRDSSFLINIGPAEIHIGYQIKKELEEDLKTREPFFWLGLVSEHYKFEIFHSSEINAFCQYERVFEIKEI